MFEIQNYGRKNGRKALKTELSMGLKPHARRNRSSHPQRRDVSDAI